MRQSQVRSILYNSCLNPACLRIREFSDNNGPSDDPRIQISTAEVMITALVCRTTVRGQYRDGLSGLQKYRGRFQTYPYKD